MTWVWCTPQNCAVPLTQPPQEPMVGLWRDFFMPSDLHTKNCTLLQHEIVVSGGLGAKGEQREGGFSINRALCSPVPFLLS